MELHRFHEVDGILAPDVGVSIGVNRAWGVGAGDGNQNFLLEVELVEGSFDHFGIGIVPDGVSLGQLSSGADSSFRVMVAKRELSVSQFKINLGDMLEDNPKHVQMECLVGEHPGLFYNADRKGFIDLTRRFAKPIESGPYRPCFSYSGGDMKFRYRIVKSSPTASLQTYAARTGRALWEHRHYTDMFVRTADNQSIPCHRAHLAGGSPVFAALLERWSEGSMPEVDVSDNHSEIEAMLEFMYTGELKAGVNAAALLPLAHRYQNTDFVLVVIERLFSELSLETAIDAVKCLAQLRDQDERLQLAWRELCLRLSRETEMVEALMLGLSEGT